MSCNILVTQRVGRVEVLTFNRPTRLNAFTNELQSAYFDALVAADRDPGVRAIVVTGAGRGFCAGGDVDGFMDEAAGVGAGSDSRPMSLPLSVRKPLIAAVNGACAGLGLVHALYADVRFMSARAKVTTSFVHRGVPPEHGTAWLLVQQLGRGRALDLMLSARVITGSEAHQIGLAEFVTEPEQVVEDAIRYAAEIADNASPRAIASAKAMINADCARDWTTALAAADFALKASFEWPDLAEGVASFQEKRQPRFPDIDGSPTLD